MKVMRFLVTGVNGFVGQHLVRELTNNNIEVVGVGGANYPTPQITEYKVLDLVKAKEAQTIDFNGI
jgi:nucleoside-diphosphate-sugar epimerase